MGPFRLSYADGSANLYLLEQAAADAEVSFEYCPVTPARSSTGMYSGGDPRSERLRADDPRANAVLAAVAAAEADPALHTAARGKGTGAVEITTRGATRTFIIQRGDALAALDRLFAALG